MSAAYVDIYTYSKTYLALFSLESTCNHHKTAFPGERYDTNGSSSSSSSSPWQVECFCDEKLQLFCFDLPKIELHAHLHGSVRPSTLLALLKDAEDEEFLLLRDILTVGSSYCL